MSLSYSTRNNQKLPLHINYDYNNGEAMNDGENVQTKQWPVSCECMYVLSVRAKEGKLA